MRTRDLALLALAGSGKPRTEYVTREVHEHRAPTDDSIRLAREYEDKAWKIVEGRIIQEIPSIDAKFLEMQDDYCTMDKLILFSVNGYPIKLRYSTHSAQDPTQVYRDLAEEITSKIMQQILSGKKTR